MSYLDACEPFFPKDRADRLKAWRAVVSAGGIPDFETWSGFSGMPNTSLRRTRYARR